MKYVKLEETIILHEEIIKEIGGLSGYNATQIGYLASALIHIRNDDYYPTITDKLTHLIFSCVKFHPFLDGNKRTAIFLGMHFLDLDDKYEEKFVTTMEDIVVKVADNSISKDELKDILEKLIKSTKQNIEISKNK